MNAHIETEINELLGFLGSKDQKTREIAIKAAAGFEDPDGAEVLLLMGLANENPQIAWLAALELLKKGKMDIDEMDHVCTMEPVKRKIAVILKASKLEDKQLAAALLSCWLADKDSGISDMVKKKLVELGGPAEEKMKILASKAPSKDLRVRASLVVAEMDRDKIRKAFRETDGPPVERLTGYEKIRRRIKL